MSKEEKSDSAPAYHKKRGEHRNGKEKPQPKAEVSSFNEPKPELKAKSKDLEFKLVEEEAECAACKTELGEGEKHWVYDEIGRAHV